jgi:hypothetical protein
MTSATRRPTRSTSLGFTGRTFAGGLAVDPQVPASSRACAEGSSTRFGSQAYCQAIPPTRAEYRISDDSLLEGVREIERRLGRSPRVAEYLRERRLIFEETLAEGHPRAIASYGKLNRRCEGEWDSILINAGLAPLGGRATGRRTLAPPKGPRVTKDVIRRALREAYEAEGDPFTVSAYMHWRAERLEGLGRFQRERYPSYHTIWLRYRTWDAACADALAAVEEQA